MVKWVIALCLLYLGGCVIDGFMTLEYIGQSQSHLETLLFGYQQLDLNWNIFQTLGSLVHVAWDYISALFGIITWDFNFLKPYLIIRLGMCCISIGFVVAAIWSATRGTQVS